jgi:hypothetical protein
VQVDRKQVWCWGTDLHDRPPHEPRLIDEEGIGLTLHERCYVADGKFECHTSTPETIRGYVDAEVGETDGCGVWDGGEVRCWRGGEAEPEGVIEGAVDVEVHYRGYCVRTEAGRVACPDGKLLSDGGPLKLVADLDDIAELEFGNFHGCLLDRAGRVRCLGWNGWGQLGVGDSQPHEGLVEVELPGPATEIAAAGEQTCAIAADRVLCWGAQEDGYGPPHFGRAEFEFEAIALHVQPELSCASKPDGSLWCWGYSPRGVIPLDEPGGIARAATPSVVPSPWPITKFHTGGILSGSDVILTRDHWPLELRESDQLLRIPGVAGFVTDGRFLTCVFGGAIGFRCIAARDEFETASWVPKLRGVSSMFINNISMATSMCAVHGGRVSCLSRLKSQWVQIPGLKNIRSVVEDGNDWVCALADDGRISCWRGSEDDDRGYQVAEGPYVLDEQDVVEIAWGWGLLARTKSGALRSAREEIRDEEFETLIEAGVVEVAGAPAGQGVPGHACARVDGDGDGRSERIVCLGDDRVGQLGRLGEHVSLQPRAVEVPRD